MLPNAEITLEANPDDLTKDYLFALLQAGVNRLSIGIQSFHDDELKVMNRRHSAVEAYASVVRAKELGFERISIDLMYGLPNSSLESLSYSINKAVSLKVEHISAYHLTYENKTAFGNFLRKGILTEIPDELSVSQYELVCSTLAEAGYEHYEISNFAQHGKRAVHNSSYWKGDMYLGIGPSAHSYNGQQRSWNVSNNRVYLELLSKGELVLENELLDAAERYNDYLITGLRTSDGVSRAYISGTFGGFLTHFDAVLAAHSTSFEIEGDTVALHESAFFYSDAILTDFMIVTE